jgi:hypothetical protein
MYGAFGITEAEIANLPPAVQERFRSSMAKAALEQEQEFKAAAVTRGGILSKVKPVHLLIIGGAGIAYLYYKRRKRKSAA